MQLILLFFCNHLFFNLLEPDLNDDYYLNKRFYETSFHSCPTHFIFL